MSYILSKAYSVCFCVMELFFRFLYCLISWKNPKKLLACDGIVTCSCKQNQHLKNFYIINDLQEKSCFFHELQDWGFYIASTEETWKCGRRLLRRELSVNFIATNIPCLSFHNIMAQWHSPKVGLFGDMFSVWIISFASVSSW